MKLFVPKTVMRWIVVRYTVEEIRGLVSDAKARLLVTDEETMSKAKAACQGLQVEFVVKDVHGCEC